METFVFAAVGILGFMAVSWLVLAVGESNRRRAEKNLNQLHVLIAIGTNCVQVWRTASSAEIAEYRQAMRQHRCELEFPQDFARLLRNELPPKTDRARLMAEFTGVYKQWIDVARQCSEPSPWRTPIPELRGWADEMEQCLKQAFPATSDRS